MKESEVILTEGFTLLDSMSAIEASGTQTRAYCYIRSNDAMGFQVGEPRMDSGMVSEGDQRPPFEPLAPLLPEEVCYILDRAFIVEVNAQLARYPTTTYLPADTVVIDGMACRVFPPTDSLYSDVCPSSRAARSECDASVLCASMRPRAATGARERGFASRDVRPAEVLRPGLEGDGYGQGS